MALGIQILRACAGGASFAIRFSRAALIGCAGLLITASIATSLARPTPQAVTVDRADSPAVLGENTEPLPAPVSVTQAWVWKADNRAWTQPAEVFANEVSGDEGASLLIRAEDLTPNAPYVVTVHYGGCEATITRPIVNLGTGTVSEEALRAAPGPGRTRPDATIPIHSIGSPPGSMGGFSLWGGTFPAQPAMKSAPADCGADIDVLIQARQSAVMLVFNGELQAGEADSATSVTPVTATLRASQ